jgi:hypothetical protein
MGQQHVDWSLFVGKTLTRPVASSMVFLLLCLFSLCDDASNDFNTGPACKALVMKAFFEQCQS